MRFLRALFKFLLFFLFLGMLNYLDIYRFGKTHISQGIRADTIHYVLVPGAGRHYPNGGVPNYAFLGRMDAAADFWKQHKHSKLILSGYDDGRYYHEADDMLAALRQRGIPDSVCVLDRGSRNTRASLNYYKKNFGSRSVVLISQPLHLHRTLWIAHHLRINAWGVEAGGFPDGIPRWFYFREYGARIKARIAVWKAA
jgi:SanA protein